MYLSIREEVGHSGVEVCKFLILVTSEDEHLALEERREPAIVTNTEVLGLCTNLSHYVRVEPSYRILRGDNKVMAAHHLRENFI